MRTQCFSHHLQTTGRESSNQNTAYTLPCLEFRLSFFLLAHPHDLSSTIDFCQVLGDPLVTVNIARKGLGTAQNHTAAGTIERLLRYNDSQSILQRISVMFSVHLFWLSDIVSKSHTSTSRCFSNGLFS